MIAASANDTHEVYLIQGYRVDENNTVIDEHQFIATYNLETRVGHSGFIEHADYDGRRIDLPKEMQDAINSSGIDTLLKLERLPSSESGKLQSLEDEGLITGFTNAIDVQQRKRPKAWE